MNSGTIRIENNTIFWDYKNESVMSINAEEISVIGEYTFESDSDDWFLVFVFDDGSWKRISMYVDNIQYLFKFLSEYIHINLFDTQLANSIQTKSVVYYPYSLRGLNLFVLTKKEIKLSEEVNNFLNKKNP